jgi:hypothetical protein
VRKVIYERRRGVNHPRVGRAVIESFAMNERQQYHIDFYLERLEHWRTHKPNNSTARLLAARDADEAHPLQSEQEATAVVEYLRRLEKQEQAAESH